MNARIMIIDDDLGSLQTLLVPLRRLNFVVTECSSATAAISHIRLHGEPTLIVCELPISGMNGLALGQHLRLKNVQVPIIFTSERFTEAFSPDKVSTVSPHMLQKPIEVESLLSMMRFAFTESPLVERKDGEE